MSRTRPEAYGRIILGFPEANELIYRLVVAASPALVGRFGSTELSCVKHFLEKRQGQRKREYPTKIASRMSVFAGFFPSTAEALDAFCQVYLDAASELDVLGVWWKRFEDVVANEVCPGASLVRIRSLEPYFHAEPWSRALAGKTVLVIHPFADSIRENFERNRTRLFDDDSVLPAFDLRTLRAVQSSAGEATGYATWFEALDDMKAQIDADRFDVCIVGAGAYGLPLAAHAKRTGRVAIHLGGATQVLFGITGRRYETDEASRFINQWWVRPTPAETPSSARSVEGGCYW
jgi:hypothetical protein